MPSNYDYPRPMQGRLAKQQLASASFHASRMYEVLDDDDRLPAWVLMKVNTAEDRLRAAADYMRYKANPTLNAYAPYPATTANYGQTYEPPPTVRKASFESTPYICVTQEAEEKMMQPLRLLGVLAIGPMMMYSAGQIDPDRPLLRASMGFAGVGVALVNMLTYLKAKRAIAEK